MCGDFSVQSMRALLIKIPGTVWFFAALSGVWLAAPRIETFLAGILDGIR